jgi:hypothetical protein
MQYPITPDTVDEFNDLVLPEGWFIARMYPLNLPEYDDPESTFSRFQLEATQNEDIGPVLFGEGWDEVVRFVKSRAAQGSEPHQEALRFFAMYTPKEWRYLEAVV